MPTELKSQDGNTLTQETVGANEVAVSSTSQDQLSPLLLA